MSDTLHDIANELDPVDNLFAANAELRADVERLLHHRTEDARLLGAAQAEAERLKTRLIELTNEGWYSQVQRLEGEIERLEKENRGLTETIEEWQAIHGTFVANPELERLKAVVERLRAVVDLAREYAKSGLDTRLSAALEGLDEATLSER